jgi:glycosyltransferase involved in cell wall biosynthesis/Tfp pilus assembly protein PilF
MVQPGLQRDDAAGPLVSLLMGVKNGMPYLPEAVWSVAAQTYPNVELVVQDGCSTDGTREFLATVRDIPQLYVVSEPDASSAEAYSRALARCRGEIIGTICADDVLEPDAVAWAVAFFAAHPDVAAVYGAATMIDEEGQTTALFAPQPFDLLRVMCCEVVPPLATAFFSRRVCGDELRFDVRAANFDFDLWLRLGHLPIVATAQRVARVRVHDASNTCRVANYDWYCRDKIATVERYLARYERSALTEAVLRHATAGIYLWAAESVLNLGPDTALCRRFLAEAAKLEPGSARLQALAERLAGVERALATRSAPPAPSRPAMASALPMSQTDGGDAWVAAQLAAAQRHADAGNWDAATRALNQVLDRDPLLVTAHYLLGCVELQRGRATAAVAALREATRLAPHAADAQNAYGAALLAAGDLPQAEAAFHAALAVAADRADIWTNLGELYERQGHVARAAAAYARVLALAPGDAAARAALERLQQRTVVTR